ncbi:MAG: glycosyltransferase family 2 protein [Streptococcaceae bacterium]|jgi:cellulose synthase/poly-beta-1,6-N-acetylglucosamine synthase-like glycosyltransferase|nr:glycosyltransferase family 2 protein [Streptococcaceae bacterium]
MFHLPSFAFTIFADFLLFLSAFVLLHLLFTTMVSIFALKKPTRDYPIVPDEKKFLMIVPAHNEDTVIKETVEALAYQNYARDLYDIVVIADNCTDHTVQICKAASKVYGTYFFENQSPKGAPRGKPHGIAALFERWERWKAYDYIAFIDADNIVEKNYLREMNSQAVAHPEFVAIQGYLGMKNVESSVMAQGYSAAYFAANRSWQYACYVLGWNAAIGGTGFILSAPYLLEHGWNPRSYTEDFELQIELSIAGARVGWNHFAVIYDEKPNSLRVSHFQRIRWAQGHWFVCMSTTFRQIGSWFRSRNLRELMSKFAAFFYSYSMLRSALVLIALVALAIDIRTLHYLPGLFSFLPFWLVIGAYNFILLPFLYIIEEAKVYAQAKGRLRSRVWFYVKLNLSMLYSSLAYMVVQIWGFLTWWRPQNNWRKTAHSMTMTEGNAK